MSIATKIRGAIRRLMIVAVTLLLALLVVEGAVRWQGYGPQLDGQRTLDFQLIEGDAELGYRYRSDRQIRHERFLRFPLVTTGPSGLRAGPGWDPDAEGPIVLLVGDSTTFCGEVDDGHTGASELWRELGEGTRVMNAGVPGYSTLQSCLAMERHLVAQEEIEVALYLFTPNDLFDNLQSIHRLPRTTPTAWWNEAQGSLCVVPAPEPLIPPGEALEDLDSELAEAEDLKLERLRTLPAHIEAVLSGSKRACLEGTPFASAMAVLPEFMGRAIEVNRSRERPDSSPPLRQRLLAAARRHSAAIHLVWTRRGRSFHYGAPTREASTVYAGSYGTHASLDTGLSWAVDNGGEDVVVALLERMDASCRARGVRFVASAFILESGDRASARFAELCVRAGVDFQALDGEFEGVPTDFAARTREGLINPHWNRRGTRAFARAIAPAVQERLGRSAKSR